MVNRGSMSKSYARVTAALLSMKHPIVVDNTPKGRFTSTQRNEFKTSNNRRFAENKEMVPRKDYDDYSKYINETHMSRRELLTGGIQMAAHTTRTGSKSSMNQHAPSLDMLNTQPSNFFKTRSRKGFSIDQHAGASTATNVKPRIIESKISE